MTQLTDLILPCRKILQEIAASGQTITYGDPAARLGTKVHQGHWEKILDPIWRACDAEGVPDLTHVVVYKSGPKRGLGAYLAEGGHKYPLDPTRSEDVLKFKQRLNEVHGFYRD